MYTRSCLLGLLVGSALSGCATIGTVQTAETNGVGQFQGGIEPAYASIQVPEQGSVLRFGYLNVSGRYGISDRVDLGGRFGTAGLEFTSKVMLTDPSATSGPIVSVAPSIGGFFAGIGSVAGGVLNAQVPVIVGIPLAEHQLVVSPKLHVLAVGGTGGGAGAGAFVASLGSSLGFAAKVGPNTRIIPEFSFVIPVAAGLGAAAGGESEGTVVQNLSEGALLQFSVGFVFGGRQMVANPAGSL